MKDKSIYSKVEHYKFTDEITEKYLGGHTDKIFARLDDDRPALKKRKQTEHIEPKKTTKDSLFFGELFRDLMSGNSHYVTYLNSEIVGKKKKDVYLPSHVSCLIKEMGPNQEVYFSECVGSRLANAFQIDTVYNIAYASPKEEWYDENEPMYENIISVDYIPWGYETETFDEFGIQFDEDTSLMTIFNKIDEVFIMKSKDLGVDLSIDKLRKFKRDFAKLFLFRQFICEDLDFESKNACILFSQDGDFKLGPCFDMELLFTGKKSVKYYESFAAITIQFMQEVMPDVLQEFVELCQQLQQGTVLDDIFQKTLKVHPGTSERYLNQVKENIHKFPELYGQYFSRYLQELAD